MIKFTHFKDFLNNNKVKIVIENQEFQIPKKELKEVIKFISKIQNVKENNAKSV